ncbi:MAG: MoaD/ThiS family protein, partial [Longimicrobiales bacterium]
MITIRIPAALKQYTGGGQDVSVTASTVGEALTRLVERHPPLRSHLYDERGSLRNFVNTYVNENDARTIGGQDADVQDGDTITIVPSIAGGAVELQARAEEVALSTDEIHRYSR